MERRRERLRRGRHATRSFPQDNSAGRGARRPENGSARPPDQWRRRLLAGGSHADADQDQHGGRRQADHERELRGRSPGLVLQKRNNGLHAKIPKFRTPPAGANPSPLLASTLRPRPNGREPHCHTELKTVPTLRHPGPSRASRRLISASHCNVHVQIGGEWYQLFPAELALLPVHDAQHERIGARG